MRAVGNRVIIQQDPPASTKGSIFLPQGKEEFPNTGVVLSVGTRVESDIKVGDRVMFERRPETALAGGWGRPEDPLYGQLALPETAIIAVYEREDAN